MHTNPQEKLCGVCSRQDLRSKLEPPMDTGRPLGRWPVSHILASQQDCTLCDYLFQVLSLDSPVFGNEPTWWEDSEVLLYTSSNDQERGCRVHIQFSHLNGFSPGTLIRTRPFDKALPSQYLLPGGTPDTLIPISGRKLNEITPWSLLRGWMGFCLSSHTHSLETVHTLDGKQWASSFRLLDVKHKCIVLADLSFHYAALSYVWGYSNPVRLGSQNIKNLMTRGGLERLSYLPKTFRDAIYITEQLRIRYLWIDALCIQHDDDHDLNHQINGMDRIYQEAVITIVSITTNADCAIPGLRPGTRNNTDLKYTLSDVELMYARPTLANAISQSDWETRGWTLQEKFFSKRMLLFTPSQIYYQCKEASWTEDAVLEPDGVEKFSEASIEQCRALNVASNSGRSRPLANDIGSGSILLNGFFEYQDLLQQYLKRSLTRDTDILAAFTGILNSLETSLGASHFGLPERVFDAALLWYGDPEAQRRPQFPSWSWCGWIPGQYREINWLVVADNVQDGEHAWVTPQKKDYFRSVEIQDPYLLNVGALPQWVRHATFTVPLPQPLEPLREPSPSGALGSHILVFEANAFSDAAVVRRYCEYQKNVYGRPDLSRRLRQFATYNLELLVMSGSRTHDTWFKRRHGTFALPLAPGASRPETPAVSINLMLIKTDEQGISERIWVFNEVMRKELPPTVRKTIYLA